MDNNFQSDLFEELKSQRKAHSRREVILAGLLALAILVIAGLSVYCMHLINNTAKEYNQRYLEFISDADFYTEYEIFTDNNSQNNGGIKVEK